MSDQQEELTPQEAMYREALSAIHSGDRLRARDLLTRLLKMAQDNPEYWIWMSAVVDSHKERIFCLKEALRIDPQNAMAKRGLILQGALPPDPDLVTPVRLQKRSWQAKAGGAEGGPGGKPASKPQYALMFSVLVVVLGLIAFAIWGVRDQIETAFRSTPVLLKLPTNTVGAVAEVTPTMPTLIPNQSTPLWMMLEATYTPTALYVNTPHAISEAYSIGIRAYQSEDWARAETYFKQVEKDQPGLPDVLYYLGEVYRQQGRTSDALEVFNDVIAKTPDFAPAYVGRARALAAGDADDLGSALKDLETALSKDPNYAEAYLESAALHLQAKQPQKALAALDKVETLMPDSPLVYLYRAQAYLANKDTRRALESAQRANQLDVTLLPVYRMMGQALQAEGKMAESLSPLVTYLTYEPDDALAWAWAANAYLAKKDTSEAIKALDRALRLNNRQVEAYLLRGQLLLDQNKAADALDDFEAALRQDPDSYQASLGIGQALMALKYPGDAYVQFEKTSPLAEDAIQKSELLFWRAQSLDALGEKVAAMRDWNALVALPASSVKPEWVAVAKERIAAAAKLTPSAKPKTATPTITATHTRQPTRTQPPTATRQPTRTATPTRTAVPSRTASATQKP